MARRLGTLATIDVSQLRGVGPKTAESLHKVDVGNVLDLLMYYPRRYIDRTKEAAIRDLQPGDEAAVLVTVERVDSRPTKSRRKLVTATVTDGRTRLKLTFFNQPWRERQLRSGMDAVVFGKLELFNGARQMTNPVVDLVGDKTGRIIPVYPQSEKAGLMSWDVAKLMDEVLERARDFAEPIPPAILERWSLVNRTEAFHWIHRPDSMEQVSEARRRLVFDELLRVQVELVKRKRELEATTKGICHVTAGLEVAALDPDSLVGRFLARLPYSLTAAQERTIGEIAHDLASPHPMHRLLQGDVGAGKTVVAVVALLVAVQGGHQGALMAPTEVLAEQHHLGVRALLDGFTTTGAGSDSLFAGAGVERPLSVALLTNRTTAAERRRLLAGLADGGIDIVIGTHALIQQGVELSSLGVVVIDEQHRFGVEQRAALKEKSAGAEVPDVLVMTATPIPRTAAMTVYGDLDVSVLDELPKGRQPIRTTWARTDLDVAGAWELVRAEVGAGRQAYVVCPLIDESEKLEVASAEETYASLTVEGAGELSGLRVGLLHGRVKAAEKERIMGAFRAGELDVLVATTVIEVGVDVPNATVMVILDADRFGIAQLHQLRGRVGRGSEVSHCFLVADPTSPDGEERQLAVKRLEALVASTDGFELAEIDLDLRGEGTLMGERQKGRNDLRLASLRRDREWVERAREVALEVVGDDPSLAGYPGLADEVATFFRDEDAADFLLKS